MSEANVIFPDEHGSDGTFERQKDAFESWVTTEPSSRYPAEAGRYHLYVSYACPWAHRTIIVRKIKQLEDIIGLSVVDPIRNDEDGWRLDEENPGNFTFLKEAYLKSDPNYQGRVTVPVLWDKNSKYR